MPVLVDGVDLRTLGFVESGWTGDLAPAVGVPASTPVPGAPGEVPTGAPGVIAPRSLTITGTLCSLAAPWTPAQLEAAMRVLTARCAGSGTDGRPGVWLAVSGADAAPTVRWRAYLSGQTTAERQGAAGLDGVAAVSLVFTALDPWAEDVTETVAPLRSVRCPVGTAPSLPVLEIDGPFEVVGWALYRGAAVVGVASGTLRAPPGVVGAGERLELDCARQAVFHVSAAGVRTPHAAWLIAGDFFCLDPAEVADGLAPLVDAQTDQATTTGRVRYRRRWR